METYLGYESNLEAYMWMNNVTLDDDLSLSLYIVFTTCYVIIISENQRLVRKEFLNNSS